MDEDGIIIIVGLICMLCIGIGLGYSVKEYAIETKDKCIEYATIKDKNICITRAFITKNINIE